MTLNTQYSKRILFANMPADGHFNPLTGLAAHLRDLGYDVRWYSSVAYSEKIKKLGIPFYPFVRALEVDASSFDTLFPERNKIKSQVGKLNFDMEHLFIRRGLEYFKDLQDLHKEFPFELLVADCGFFGIPFVREKMGIPVLGIGVMPLVETSVDLGPTGLAMHPAQTVVGRWKQAILRQLADRVLFRYSIRLFHRLLEEEGIRHQQENLFDMVIRRCDILLQSGTPGFEYNRSDLGENIRFAGPLLPHQPENKRTPWFDERLNQYERVLLVTQGTVERDVNKLLVPFLEAFRNSNYLLVITTGGAGTDELQQRYQAHNIIIRDNIPFGDVMPYADAYISNGGYGGVLMAIQHQLPMVVAGVHEGKNEINARIGYFKLGIDLRTEKPTVAQLRQAVERVVKKEVYRANVLSLAREFSQYQPNATAAASVSELLQKARPRPMVPADLKVF